MDPESKVQREPAFTQDDVPAGLYVCNDKGEFRKVKTEDLKNVHLKECVVCFDAEKKLVACVPCGHRCMCQDCYDKLRDRRCPVCRNPIQSTLKMWDRNAELPKVKCGNRYWIPLD